MTAPLSAPGTSERISIIGPRTGRLADALGELWRYRELFIVLVGRDIRVKYKQTAIGVAWAVLQPLVSMVVFTLFFGKLAGIPSGGLPYWMFALAGVLPWTYFSTALAFSSGSLVANANLLSKVYFPRALLPLSAAAAGLLDLVIGTAMLVVIRLFLGGADGIRPMYLIAFAMLAFVAAGGIGLLLSSINVKYRDVQYAVPFFIQLGLFVTPVVYPSELVPGALKYVYALNPMVAVVDGFRWAIAGGHAPDPVLIGLSSCATLICFAGGSLYFRSVENELADVV